MNYLNGLNIEQLIDSLGKAIVLAESTKNQDKSISNTMVTALSKNIDAMNEQIKYLKTINKNTFYTPTFIDCHALIEALNNYGNPIESAKLIPFWNDQKETNPDSPPNKFHIRSSPDGFIIQINYSRYTMNGAGYHVGYENVTFKAVCIHKKELNIYGFPWALSSYVVNPNSFEIESKQLPPEEYPTIDSHEKTCDVFKRDLAFSGIWNPEKEPYPDDCSCDCNDNWDGYFHPEDDFFTEEIDNIIRLILEDFNTLPEAEYNKETGWSIGNEVTWTIGEESNDDSPYTGWSYWQ